MKKRFPFFFLLVSSLWLLAGCSPVHHYAGKDSELKVKHVWQPQAFDSLNVDIYVDDVELHTSQNYKVVYYGHKTFLPQVNSHHHLLTIKQKPKNSSISGEQLLSIYLPPKQLNELRLRCDDGEIDFPGSIKAKNISLNSGDGDIKINHLTANRGRISSNDGDITITALISKKGFALDSDDGDIRVKHSNANGYHLSSDDGDVIYKGNDYDNDDVNDDGGSYRSHLNRQNVLRIKSDDGDINVN